MSALTATNFKNLIKKSNFKPSGGWYRLLFFSVLMLWYFSSCSPVRYIGENEYLLNKNIVKSDKKDLNAGIESILKQKPNRKILGLFRFHLGVYSLANRGKENGFKRWVKKTIGEEPVLLDPELTKKSRTQAEQYVQNNGFFKAIVTDSTIYKKRKKANVIYSIKTGDPYILRNINYSISDPVVKSFVLSDSSNSVLKTGDNFNASKFQEERERVTNNLKNLGYYEFNQLYISYDIDTALKSNQADVKFIIAGTNQVNANGDTIGDGRHKLYRINKIFIQTDYDPLAKKIVVPTDTVQYKDYYFTSSFHKLKYKPEALIARVNITKNDFYKIKNAERTYKNLSSLSLFKFINIQFSPEETDSVPGYWLNSYIYLTPSPKQDYKIELEGTHNGGNFGIGGNISYRNKNFFKAAESIELKLKARVESIPDFVDTTDQGSNGLSLNTREIGPELTLRIPRFLWPLGRFNRSTYGDPVTLFTASYNYQKRPEYKRNQLVLSSGFEFRETQFKKHYVYPAEINNSKFDLAPAFVQKLKDINDPQLIIYYRDYLITNGRYSFVYNTQRQDPTRDFLFFRFTFELAGNSIRLLDMLTHSDYSKDKYYELAGNRYSQYFRPDFDFRYYQLFSSHSQIVYRFTSGVGIAYLNSNFLPYEKTFFAGGSNDLRAFRARTVGPGGYQTDNYLEQLGEIKINMNVEYRVDIFKILKGALFVDAGNIWLRKNNKTTPKGQFNLNTAPGEMAIGTGLGVRFDFTFFIFRLDAGIPLKDPGRDEGDRWVVNDLKFSSVVYNFGIGYPF